MRRGDGIRAVFIGGPADSLTLQVHGTEPYIAVINGRPRELPDSIDEPTLNQAGGRWTLYRATAVEEGGRVVFKPA